ncbi:MAG: ankyrin repeat domain-containing protein [Vicinamibacterales bacterium]
MTRAGLVLGWALVLADPVASAQTLPQAPPLVEAARQRNLGQLRALIGQRTPVNVRQADGATALHWAAHWDEGEMAGALLAAGADANAADDLGVTPLSLACTNASVAMVERLLVGGAGPDAPAHVPPLVTCARTGNADAVKALVARRADVRAKEPARDQTALMTAVAQGHVEVVRVLLAAGSDVRARSRVTRALVNRANPNDITAAMVGEVSQGGSTPLLFAARQGDVRVGELLLAAGADVNDIAPDGTSVLTTAVHGNHTALALLLLEKGANPNVIGSGYSALHAAVLRGNARLATQLLVRRANVNSRLRNGTATTRGSREYFLPESLVGATPLMLAAKFLEPGIVQELLAKGADPRLTLQDGTTVLMAAAGVGSETRLFDRRDRISVLKDSDEAVAAQVVAGLPGLAGDVNAANEAGNTALHGAAKMNYPSIVTALAARGARLDARNKKGDTPLAVASGEEARQALRAAGARE